MGSKQLTLERLAWSFSVCTATLIINRKIPGKLVSKLYPTLPSILLSHTIFPTLIPTNTKYTDDLREIAIILNMEMSILLANRKGKRKMSVRSLDELMEASARFVDAAINGGLATNTQKIRVLAKALIVDIEGEVTTLKDEMKLMVARTGVIKAHARKNYHDAVMALAVLVPKDKQGSCPAESSAAGPSGD